MNLTVVGGAARLRLVVATVAGTVTLLVVAAGPARASCLPAGMQTFDEPGLVVVAGTVTDMNDEAVGVVVEHWWGDGARSTIAIRRPATDPTVISSTDWTPKLGERWIVAGTLDGETLVTGVCRQWPVTPEALAEVVRSRGEAATSGPSNAAPPGGDPSGTAGDDAEQAATSAPAPPLPLVAGGAAVAAAGVLALLVLVRRRPH